jgi:hypothetical protein
MVAISRLACAEVDRAITHKLPRPYAIDFKMVEGSIEQIIIHASLNSKIIYYKSPVQVIDC